jgi:hypothetical protein
MSKYYWHCPECEGNFDHGESCDCGHEESPSEYTEKEESGLVLKS